VLLAVRRELVSAVIFPGNTEKNRERAENDARRSLRGHFAARDFKALAIDFPAAETEKPRKSISDG
jgi:hypothetical protein